MPADKSVQEMLSTVTPQHRYTLSRLATEGGTLTAGVWDPVSESGGPRELPQTHGAPPTVVALHGVTGNHCCWPFVVANLPGVRVIAPDLRGRGGSAQMRGPYGIVPHTEDIRRLLDHFEVRRAAIVGHSMGGFIAVVAADQLSDRVAGLVLVDGGLPMGNCSTHPAGMTELLGPLLARVTTMYPTVASAVQVWRQHPALRQDWSVVAEAYARYDIGGRPPALRCRARHQSLLDDTHDLVTGSVWQTALARLRHPTQALTASSGLLNEPPGVYPPPVVAGWKERYPEIGIRPVYGVNHYSIVMGAHGARHVAGALADTLAQTGLWSD